AIAFLGSTPIGAPLMGWVSDSTSPRVALGVGAVATIFASALLARRWLGRRAYGGEATGAGGANLQVAADGKAWQGGRSAEAAAS
ncbi:MAG TPA: hypothetical protein VMD28_05175, partial [Acidimicrobiales bacterium]|nr:hypothetical protein [Acidimicrobiales bacterium]